MLLAKRDTAAPDLAVIETILRNRTQFFHEIRDGIALPQKMKAMLVSSLAFFALYGAVMGSTHSLWQTLSSAFKLPLLFNTTRLLFLGDDTTIFGLAISESSAAEKACIARGI